MTEEQPPEPKTTTTTTITSADYPPPPSIVREVEPEAAAAVSASKSEDSPTHGQAYPSSSASSSSSSSRFPAFDQSSECQESLASAKTLSALLGLTPPIGAGQGQSEEALPASVRRQPMELRQFELLYRAEGNANLVVALPQFKKVLRLPKMLTTAHEGREEPQEQRRQHRPEQHNLQGLTSERQHHKGKEADDDDDNLTMANFVAYIDRVRQLIGPEYVFEAHVVDIPREEDRQWLNDRIRPNRPVQRLSKEFFGRYGLLLPDATQLPSASPASPADPTRATIADSAHGDDTLFSNLQSKASNILTADTWAIEIKPKQGWHPLREDLNDLFNIEIKATTATTTKLASVTSDVCSSGDAMRPTKMARMDTTDEIRCRYCAMQYLKLKQHKISRVSDYCPMDLFSGVPSRMLAALHALLMCPQNNLRIYRNGNLIYGDHSGSLTWQQLNATIFQGEQGMPVKLLKHLLVMCLLRDYTVGTDRSAGGVGGSGGCDEGDVGGIEAERKPTKADIVKAVSGQPHSSATMTRAGDADADVSAEAKTITTKETETKATGIPPTPSSSSSSLSPSPSPSFRTQINEAEMLCLPENCVLHKILQLQLLAKRNLRYMHKSGYGERTAKTYKALRALLARPLVELTWANMTPEMAYLMGATAMDCSIMIAWREVTVTDGGKDPLSPHVVYVPEYQRSFLTKVTLLDLDPKPDCHFHKYLKQSREAYEAIPREH